MPLIWLLALLAALSAAGFVMGRRRAVLSSGGDVRRLHSLPNYYGFNVGLAVIVPSLLVLFCWLLVQPLVIEARVAAQLSPEALSQASDPALVMSDVRRLAEGLDVAIAEGAMSGDDMRNLEADGGNIRAALGAVGVALGSEVEPSVLVAAQSYIAQVRTGNMVRNVTVILLALAGFLWAMRLTAPGFRARGAVERAVLALLIAAASIAILTTAGIVLSMLFESINFFRQYPISDFFFGTTWSPNFRGNSDLGILPLLWGTLYISFIALLVAVPVGLFSAIYLSEYAGPKVRGVAKPLIEVLAGIPTIVYGLFALITVGPLLRDHFAQPLGLGESGSSVMTAGLVMGIMLIPFVSSLSDDIINAVPQSMRDGSLGLGATKSETIRQVVVPAALPGIVGAVLLAASRAIGETMIVVLGAGAAAKLDLNPFEAMTTVTVKIVSQLTGDTDFAAPETLVAFALGLTLFVITLGLNVIALVIVRKYREQYE
ncbi:phosphate ABC transporter permease subunit PstC [Oceaniglobus trochenteri]|uniref:phosphate ABC transporter permease subunit PstC n=1 Tax=Oceaniglobus trochenteri TaxID=2763260 RepID=UPI001CFF6F03|nr:phosphate ABC transporter permease subunit PstC [Oceaniglobus trochenteri]